MLTKSESPAYESNLMKAFETRDIKCFRDMLKDVDVNLADSKTGLSIIFGKILKANNPDDSIEFIREYIEHGADINLITENGQHPLHLVAESACVTRLRFLLPYYKNSDMNITYMQDNCLHILAKMLIKSDNSDKSSFKNISECMQMLLKKGCDPNLINEKEKTPFHLLLKAQKSFDGKSVYFQTVRFVSQKSHDEEKTHLEEIGNLVKFFIEYSKIEFNGNEKMQQLFQEFNSNLLPITDWQKRENYTDFLLRLISPSDEVRFKNHFEIFKAKAIKKEWDNVQFISKAVENNVIGIVEFLVKEGVHVNGKDANNVPPKFLAARKGYHEILEILLKAEPKHADKFKGKSLLLEVCPKFGEKSPYNINYQKCFVSMMKNCADIDVNAKDEKGFTALYYAAIHRNVEAQKMLLQRRCYVGMKNRESPFNYIDKQAFADFLDDCVENISSQGTDNGNEEITVDFTFLIKPEFRKDQKDLTLDISPLKTIVENKKLQKLITHPVLMTVVQTKWQEFQPLFLLNLVFFFFFLMLSLIAFIVVDQPEFRSFFQVTTSIGLIVLIIREGFQLYFNQKEYFHPIRSYMNYLEIFLICVAIKVLFFLDCDDTSMESKIMRISTIALVSYEVMQLLNPLSKFDVSIHMFIMTTVAKTFLNSIVIFSIPLMTFSLCFYILSVADKNSNSNNASDEASSNKSGDDESHFNSFGGVGIALLKTFVMMTGEFDASNFNFSENLPILIVFILYVFFGFMVIFNLLNALAVNDTNAIKTDGQQIDLIQKVEWLSRYIQILDLKKQYSNCFSVKKDEIQSSSQKPLTLEIPIESESKNSKANIQYDKENETMKIEYRESTNNILMDENMFREFHTLLERKDKKDFKKKKNEKIEDILCLLKQIQTGASAVMSDNVN